MTTHRRLLLAIMVAASLLAAACSDDAGTSESDDPSTEGSVAEQAAPEPPPVNPFLADSVVPIGHGNSAQTDSVATFGPGGPTETLTEDDLTYTHLGPAHFGIAISPPYEDGRRTIWSNGGDRISKLDYETLDIIDELELPDKELQTEAQADADIAELDGLEGRALADAGVAKATQYLTGLSGVYYLLDADNTLFVGGSESILAYNDSDPSDPDSPIEQRDEWEKPAEIGGNFVGANLTFDGRVAMVTDEGWVVVVTRDFSEYESIQLPGADDAPAHNQRMADEGFRSGAADWVRNSLAVDEDGGIYVPSVDNMHKVVWDGTSLSTDPADGAWSEPYANGTGIGSGATPSLMGFGDEDQFVVITDGDEVMNVVLFWRDDGPEGWEAPEGAPSDRIAGQLPADMGDDTLTSIQTEQSVVVGGYGAFVVNNDPASIPEDFPDAGTRVLAGYAGADPAFTPHGLQKFEWDPDTRAFSEDWVNTEVSSANSVPIVSTGSDLLYTVGARDGDWTMEAVDWSTGESAFHYVTGSVRYNSLFSGINLDEDGRLIHTTAFGIVRYERPPADG